MRPGILTGCLGARGSRGALPLEAREDPRLRAWSMSAACFCSLGSSKGAGGLLECALWVSALEGHRRRQGYEASKVDSVKPRKYVALHP